MLRDRLLYLYIHNQDCCPKELLYDFLQRSTTYGDTRTGVNSPPAGVASWSGNRRPSQMVSSWYSFSQKAFE